MIITSTWNETIVTITFTKDVEPNEGGYYCEVYLGDTPDNKIDDFCIHPTDCDCTNMEEVESYARKFMNSVECY